MQIDSATDSLKAPPFSIEAEQSVLGGLMLNNAAWILIADLITETDFYRPEHQLIFKSIKSLSEEGHPCDVVTLSEWLTKHHQLDAVGGLPYLGQLVKNTPSAANIVAYTEIVRERSILRQLVQVGNDIAQSAFYTQGRTSAELLDHAEKLVFEIAEQGIHRRGGFMEIKELLSTTLERIDLLFQHEGKVTGVATGFTDFDEKTSGLQRSDLIIVAGRPSQGKTSFAMNMAEHVAIESQLPVAVFSMEMSSEQLTMRLLASTAKVDLQKVRTGKLNDDDWAHITKAISKLEAASLFIDDTPALNPTELRARLRRLAREKGRLGLVVIDYLQLMQVPDTKESRANEVSEISRSLKSLAKELNVPIIALSQLNRSLEQRPDKRPRMADLRESGCLAGDSLVTLADTGQRVSIRELVGQTDFSIWALNLKTLQLESAKVSRVFCTGVKPVFRLTTQLGRTIRATANHKFYTPTGWKRLDELNKNDYLAIPRHIPTSQLIKPMAKAEIALLGHLLGDGCTLPRHAIQYTTREKDLAELVVQLAVEVFGTEVKPRINPERHWFQVYLTSIRQHTHHVRSIVSEWLDQLGCWGLRSYEKYVPTQIFQQSAEGIAIFLRHLWSTDGCIRLNKGTPHMYYASSSQQLSYDVQTLLLMLGINARIKKVSQGHQERDQFHVILSGKQEMLNFANNIGTVGIYKNESLEQIRQFFLERVANTNRDILPKVIWEQQVRTALETTGITHRQLYAKINTSYAGIVLFKQNLSRERALRIAQAMSSEELRKLAQSGTYWDKIADIQPMGEEEVFDLTVPTLHNFIANNIIVHNSIEQDADLIVFIYRDEVYNEESPDKGTAEIIIAKQRNGPIGTVRLTFLGHITKFGNYTPDRFYGE